MLSFHTLMLFTNILMAFYVYKRFFKINKNSLKTKSKLHIFFYRPATLLLGISATLYMNFKEDAFFDIFIIAFIFLFGLLILLFLSTLFNDLIYFCLYLFQKITKRNLSKALYKKVELGLLIINILYIFAGFYSGLALPTVKETTIKIDNFPIDNFKIVLLADLHIGYYLQKEFCNSVVELVNNLDADLVIIAGDLIDKNSPQTESSLAPLKNLKSRYGTFFVLGNHEYYVGAYHVIKLLPFLNIHPLLDQTVQIGEGHKKFNLMGVSTPQWQHAGRTPVDFAKANEQRNFTLPTILVSHRPNIKVDGSDNIDLILAGHTHGGQIFPFHILVKWSNKFLAGLYKFSKTNGKTQIYLTKGAGLWGPPVRFLAPAEISYLTIRTN